MQNLEVVLSSIAVISCFIRYKSGVYIGSRRPHGAGGLRGSGMGRRERQTYRTLKSVTGWFGLDSVVAYFTTKFFLDPCYKICGQLH